MTEFAVDVLGITDRDVVYDPTCGTAGFLVAAFDYVRRNCSADQIIRFKNHCLFGVEQEAEVVALAIVNMIFRGDGKNNIIEGNCFQKHIARSANAAEYVKETPASKDLAVTRVLMNPPFALKDSDEKEYRFVDHALNQMVDGGLLFAVLPYPAMVKPGAYQQWREGSLLKDNSLLCVMTLPPDLFYPVGVHTVGIFVKKGVPHPGGQQVLWVRTINDGLLKSKGKRLPNTRATNDLRKVRNLVKAFLANPNIDVTNTNYFQKSFEIDLADPLLELVPENYLDQSPASEKQIRDDMSRVIAETVAFVIRSEKPLVMLQ